MRSHLNPFFSKRRVLSYEPQIRSTINRLIHRLHKCHTNKQIVRIDAAYSALTLDVVTRFAFGEDEENLNHPNFNLVWKEAILGTLSVFTFLQMFPWLWPVLNNMPVWLTERLDPGMGRTVRWQMMIENLVDGIIRKNKEGKRVDGTIFQAILDSDRTAYLKSRDAMVSEGIVVIGTGSETTAQALNVATFFLYRDREMLKKLREELGQLTPQEDGLYDLAKLEKLPYLVSHTTQPHCHLHPAVRPRPNPSICFFSLLL